MVKSLLGKIHIEDKYSVFGNGIAITVTCSTSNNELEIFSSFTDGYNAEFINVLYEFGKIKIFQNSFSCNKCNKGIFRVIMKYEYIDTEDLENDKIKDISNSFSWIWISLECESCKKF